MKYFVHADGGNPNFMQHWMDAAEILSVVKFPASPSFLFPPQSNLIKFLVKECIIQDVRNDR